MAWSVNVTTYFALPKEMGLMGPQTSEKTRKRGTVVLSESWIVRKGVRVCLPRIQCSQDLLLCLMPI